MSDLIDRQAAIEAIDAVFPVDPMKSVHTQGIALGAALAKTYIEQLPSAQPEQRTGKWIDVDVMGMPAQACDQCKTFFPLAYTGGGHHYCPNCGAKMEVNNESN